MYNLKLIEYPNGSVQIRLYDGCMGMNEKHPDLQYEISPFDGFMIRSVKEFSNADENKRKSLARTKSRISTFARCACWEWFVTLTFDGARTDRTNYRKCMERTRNWLHNCRLRYQTDLKYLAVPELHSDGRSWHVHALLSDTGNMPFADSGRKKSDQVIYNLSGWKWGFSTATRVRDIYRIQKYIIKYITKDFYVHVVGAHRYYASKNLSKPKETVMYVESGEQEDIILKIADSLGLEEVHRSQPMGSYIPVTYIELQ